MQAVSRRRLVRFPRFSIRPGPGPTRKHGVHCSCKDTKTPGLKERPGPSRSMMPRLGLRLPQSLIQHGCQCVSNHWLADQDFVPAAIAAEFISIGIALHLDHGQVGIRIERLICSSQIARERLCRSLRPSTIRSISTTRPLTTVNEFRASRTISAARRPIALSFSLLISSA